MNEKLVEQIANAVLYEGYMLYPYRPSAIKNRQRWNFGLVYPRSWAVRQTGADGWFAQTECLAVVGPEATIGVKARFLQLISRTVGELQNPAPELSPDAVRKYHAIPELRVGDQLLRPWQEAVEREVVLAPSSVEALALEPVAKPFALPPFEDFEQVRDRNEQIAWVIVRKQKSIQGGVYLTAVRLEEKIYKVTLTVANETRVGNIGDHNRDLALLHSLVSAHSILRLENGEFVSLLDPPPELQDFARECSNVGTWPVLAGEQGERDGMLSSPIILYDYPQIAPESSGDLFDATEIDEILSLRILTLTEDEKREIRQSDDRARKILERTESLPAEQLLKLHGAMRSLRPSSGGQG